MKLSFTFASAFNIGCLRCFAFAFILGVSGVLSEHRDFMQSTFLFVFSFRVLLIFMFNFHNSWFTVHFHIHLSQVCSVSTESSCKEVVEKDCSLVQDVVCRNVTETR